MPSYPVLNRSSKPRLMVAVRTKVPAMKATPSTTEMHVEIRRRLCAHSDLKVSRNMGCSVAEGLHEVDDVLGARIVQLVHDLPVRQDEHAIGVGRGHGVVGDHHDRLAVVG